ncbi:MAG: hypothetical protein JXA10_18210, partial [Anaerolineae bacterium]|nr:hypothetical protein [Anaerolineae bacterium]
TVVATAAGGIGALGDDHNQAVIRADVARLLDDNTLNADPAVILQTDTPGKRDAVARVGGPFARVIPFTTPEEASQQLGRVIVGNPGAEPYDLSVTFTLRRGATTTQDTITIVATTDAHIIDTPFAWDGALVTAQWSAEIALTWRGATLTYSYQSAPLFPAIPVWRYQVVDVTDDEPQTILDWTPHIYTAVKANVIEGHDLTLWHDYLPQINAGTQLAAHCTTTIISPAAREVVLKLFARHEVELTLNGAALTVPPEDASQAVQPPFYRPMRTLTGMTLRAGENVLAVTIRPPSDPAAVGWPFWGMGAALVTPEGSPMPDLAYK